MLSDILLVFFFLQTIYTDLCDAYCPCQIYVKEYGIPAANCRNLNLTTIPDCVPDKTQWLDFSFNDLRYTPGQFQRFRNITHLYISVNENFDAHNDSFQFLFNLEVLDLSITVPNRVNGETFHDQSRLKYLGLRGVLGGLDISEELFNHLGSLELLVLASQSGLSVQDGSFAKLPLLSKLDLGYISALKLYNHTFDGLSALKYLNLQDSTMQVFLPVEVFHPLTSLKELHLQGLCGVLSPTFDCTDVDKRLQHIPSLKKLYIDKQLISHLGKGFCSLRKLEELSLVNSIMDQTCEIADFHAEIFKHLRYSPLKKLVLDRCNFDLPSPELFKYFSKLTEISLSVETVWYNYFWRYFSRYVETTTLNSVDLSFTLINMFDPPRPFEVTRRFNETQLSSLKLTGTRYNSLSDASVHQLPKSLKVLNLTQNYIQYVYVESLGYLDNLETLDLSNQVNFREQYPKLSKYSKTFASKWQNVSLPTRNQGYSIQRMSHLRAKLKQNHKTECLSLPYRLKYLDVSKSSLLCNMVDAFCDSNNSLKVLNASKQRDIFCFKTHLFWNLLRNLANLEELNLDGNLISDIQLDAFSGLHKLMKLSLVDNKLLEVSFYVKDLVSLDTLDLSANSIRYASTSFTDQIEDISWKTNLTIYLNINPLVGNCKQLHFVAWLMKTHAISNKKSLNCTFENETLISLESISDAYHALKYKCTMLGVVISCAVTFWGLSLVLGGLVYIGHYRLKLKYLVSFGKRTLNPYHPIGDNEIQMEYDVYISYEGDFNVTPDRTLRDFVIYTILPGLERRGIKVIIREELDPGTRLYEVITQTVRRSKKVLAFLTNGYCQDMWNVFEFNQAVMEGIYTNRQVAIPVLFESLRRDRVKDEICEFLRMEPVHKYSTELSDRAFIDFLYERIRDTRKFG